MKKFPRLFLDSYTISKHEKEIVEFFGGYAAIEEDIERFLASGAKARASGSVVICFTNRSGSNLLAHALAVYSDASRGGEFFNSPAVLGFCRKRQIKSFSEYCLRLQQKTMGEKKIFCTKLAFPQLFFLIKIGVIPHLIPNPQFVHIKRKNVLGQAVSFSIASQTAKWTSEQQGTSKPVVFDAPDIIKRVRAIVNANASFDQFFALTGEKVAGIYYEDLENDLINTMKGLTSFLQLHFMENADGSSVPLKRQRTTLNDEFSNLVRQLCSIRHTL